MDTSIVAKKVTVVNQEQNRMANNVYPDEIGYHESSNLDLHCLQKYLFYVHRAERVNL